MIYNKYDGEEGIENQKLIHSHHHHPSSCMAPFTFFFFLSLSTNTEQAQHLFIYFGWLVGRRQDEKQLPAAVNIINPVDVCRTAGVSAIIF